MRFFFIVAILFSSFVLSGQSTETLWLDYNLHINKNDRVQFYGDIGYRTILVKDSETRLNIRPSVRYKWTDRWMLRGGVGLFYEIRPLITNRFELRPFQGIQFNIDPFAKLKMNVLGRIEERISFDDITEDRLRFDVRVRLRLSGRYEFLNPVGDNYWFIPYSVELFRSVEENITEFAPEKARMFLGLGYNFDEYWRLTFLVNWEIEGRLLDPDALVNSTLFQFKVRRQIQWSEMFSDND